MNLTLKEQLQQWKRENKEIKERKRKQSKRKPSKQKGKLSEGDLRYLMGTNRQTLRRGKGGAWK